MKRRFWQTVVAVLYWHSKAVWWETGPWGFVAYALVIGSLGYKLMAVGNKWPGKGLYTTSDSPLLSPMIFLGMLPLVVILSYDFIRLWYGVWRGEN